MDQDFESDETNPEVIFAASKNPEGVLESSVPMESDDAISDAESVTYGPLAYEKLGDVDSIEVEP